MKNIILALFTALFILMLSFTGCKKEDSVTSSQSTKNNLVVTNVPNAFTFVVDASNRNHSDSYQLQLNADTLTIAVTVSNYVSGSGSLTIKDNSKTFNYVKDLGSNLVAADVMKLTAVPNTVSVVLANYSGKITIAVAGK